MTINTVTTGDIITAEKYNELHTLIADVLGTSSLGYGSNNINSVPVNSNTIITADQWARVYDDINRCIVHQTNASIPSTTIPLVGDIIYASFVNALITATNTADTNRYTVAAGQLALDTVGAVSTRSTAWGPGYIEQLTRHTWDSSLECDYFYNLGGKLSVSFSYPGGVYTGDDLAWKNLIDAANVELATYIFDRSGHIAGDPAPYTKSSDIGSITVRFIQTDSTALETNVQLDSLAATAINIDVTCAVNCFYSRGDTVPAGVYSPRPIAAVIVAFEGSVTPPTTTSRRLAYSPVPIPVGNITTGGYVDYYILISNYGTAPVTINNVLYTSNGVTPIIKWYAGGVFYETASVVPFSLLSSEGIQLYVKYSAQSATGTFYNSITIVSSNNDLGNVVIPTTQIVGTAAFDFTIPPDITVTLTSRSIFDSAKFTITPINGSFSGYSLDSSTVTAGFSVATEADGPRIIFVPGDIPNGTYTYSDTGLLITVNGITKVARVTITLAVADTYNLGSWLGPQSIYNSVIGASYDVIAGIRYLTLGFGMGTDGAPIVNNGGSVFASVAPERLGITTDSKMDKGVVLYPYTEDAPNYSTFLQQYGAWIRYNDNGPKNIFYITRYYSFVAPVSGNYNWTFAIDNFGYFEIDGNLVGDLRGGGDHYTNDTTGQVYLTAGSHILTFGVAGDSYGNSAIGIRIVNALDNSEVWSTSSPVRSNVRTLTNQPYVYWNEVYRIPITNVGSGLSQTYYSSYFYIKNSSALANTADVSWGSNFGTGPAQGSMFTVVSDTFGNLTITINPPNGAWPATEAGVTGAITDLGFYYYIEPVGYRVVQLESPVNGNTKVFLGFSSTGAVRTSAPLPVPIFSPPSDGGGDGGGGFG